MKGWSSMVRYKANLTYILQKGGVRGAKPPETLENFYVTANEIYWDFIKNFNFPIFYFNFSPLLILQKNFGGVRAPKRHSPPAYAPNTEHLKQIEK